ncbi:hypothetical protein WA026_015056 [Henosepilachna vigintioctopunctata]|uniref:Uncharacterized protein n=1 Tax=Henosepilachna vigintioctopunctata TaxID=420089 RepID=A0AAW1U2N8_9CUCU
MSKKQSQNSRPDGEYIETPRPRQNKQSPGPLSKRVWGATADELLLDSMDLITELMRTWEGGEAKCYRCKHEDGDASDSSSGDEYENSSQITGRKK